MFSLAVSDIIHNCNNVWVSSSNQVNEQVDIKITEISNNGFETRGAVSWNLFHFYHKYLCNLLFKSNVLPYLWIAVWWVNFSVLACLKATTDYRFQQVYNRKYKKNNGGQNTDNSIKPYAASTTVFISPVTSIFFHYRSFYWK